MIQRDSPNVRLHVARIRWRRNLSLTLTILSRTCFSTATPVWARPFFPTASLTIFWTVHTVCFIFLHSSFLIFLQASAFSRGSDAPDDEPIFDCDLLIIDDLGTELTNSFVSSQLFLCINERIMRKKSTIISTNLKLEDFSATYSERTFPASPATIR